MRKNVENHALSQKILCLIFQVSRKENILCRSGASILYLPDSNLAWVVAFSTSQGEEPQVVKIG